MTESENYKILCEEIQSEIAPKIRKYLHNKKYKKPLIDSLKWFLEICGKKHD